MKRCMFLSVIAVALVFLNAPSASQAQTKEEKIKQLQAEIQKTREKLAELEKELATLQPPPVGKLELGKLEVGQRGKFNPATPYFYFEVAKVLGEDEALVYPVVLQGGKTSATGEPMGRLTKRIGERFIVKGIPTNKVADGQKINLSQAFEIEGTKKVGDKTYLLLKNLN